MSKRKDNKPGSAENLLEMTTTSTLPGLQGVYVIVARPVMIKENSSKPTKK